MGMYDSVYLDSKLLPVNANIQMALDGEEFQTKDFECELKSYHITNDGFLECDEYDGVWDENQMNAFGGKGVFVCSNERRERVDFHGFFRFYTLIDKEMYTFRAKFTDGKLVHLELLNPV